MEDGILEGAEIISLVGNAEGKLNKVKLESLEDSEGLEERIENLCERGLMRKEDNFLYLTVNGKRIYEKLQKKYS